MHRNFYPLIVSDVTPEIGGAATSVVFDVPVDLKDIFSWQAGQHLTLKFRLDGKEERRSYSISNPPDAALRITVKRVKGGKVSNHVGDRLQVGDIVDVMPPFGNFFLAPGATKRRTHYFFAAGSGITPIYAMVKAVLDHEQNSVAHLVYGNADAKTVLFADDLAAVVQDHPDRITLRHVLSAPSMWSRVSPWRTGRIDASMIGDSILETPPVAQDVQYWVCGPGTMNEDVKAALMSLDVPASRIHMETFCGKRPESGAPDSVSATVLVKLNGTVHDVTVEAGETLLDAALKAGLRMPYSCQSGVCGACKGHLKTGKVTMTAHMALEDRDIAKGEILTCQSYALDSRLEITVDR